MTKEAEMKDKADKLPDPEQLAALAATAAEAPSEEQKPEAQPCVHCGWIEDGPEPRPEDKEEYLRSVLGGRRFTKTYMPWDGQLTLKFRSLSAKEAEFVNQVLSKNVYVNEVELGDAAMKAKLLFQLTSFVTTEKNLQFEPPAEANHTITYVQAEFEKRFGGEDETILRVIAKMLHMFNMLLQLLVLSGFDRNFYKAAGPL